MNNSQQRDNPSLIRKFIRLILKRYLRRRPISEDLISEIEKYDKIQASSETQNITRKKQIEDLLIKSYEPILWANSGSILSLLLTLASFVFTVLFVLSGILNGILDTLDYHTFIQENQTAVAIVIFVFTLFLSLLFLVIVTPSLLDKIVQNLPARKYAELTTSNLNRSETLSFIGVSLYSLCDNFLKNVEIPQTFIELNACDENEPNGERGTYSKHFSKIRDDSMELSRKVDLFKTKHHSDILKCYELKKEAIDKLKILPREFSHHILKFSIPIFQVRLNIFSANVESIHHLHEIEKNPTTSFSLVSENIKEVVRIWNGTRKRRDRDLFQIIQFRDIHENLIGLSSVTSTSESLKIFARAISTIAAKNNSDRNIPDEYLEIIYEELKAVLHRSKAHYGFDLLITLENFYRKSTIDNKDTIIEHLHAIVKEKQSDLTTETKREYLDSMREVRTDIMRSYPNAIQKMSENFEQNLNKLKIEKEGSFYIVVFGYSKMVRNMIRRKNETLSKMNCKVFVLKEDDELMLDTRIFRFELADDTNHNYKNTFTSSDESFVGQLNPKDTVLFLGGAEAFDTTMKKLYHTNDYQTRVEELIKNISTKTTKKINVWIVASQYKLYSTFPDPNSKFGDEYFSDHYDKLDIYDFNDIDEVEEVIPISS